MTATQHRPTRTPARRHDHAKAGSHPFLDAGCAAVGQALGLVFGGVARLRRNRPLHPVGATYAARVLVTDAADLGVPWLDEPSTADATVRVSRSAGLPGWLPDILGVALRITSGGKPADLLFSTTGGSALGRFLLQPRLRLGGQQLTTLLPVRSPAGPLLLGLVADVEAPGDQVPRRFRLSWAIGRGPWQEAGEVRLGDPLPADVDVQRRDPVVHQLPGTEQYPVVTRLREPSYRASRAVTARPRP